MELYEWSTLSQIAEACGQSNDTVQVYLNKMYKRGEVVRERRYVGERNHPTYFYKLVE